MLSKKRLLPQSDGARKKSKYSNYELEEFIVADPPMSTGNFGSDIDYSNCFANCFEPWYNSPYSLG